MFKFFFLLVTMLFTLCSCFYGVPNKTMFESGTASLVDLGDKGVRLDLVLDEFDLSKKVIIDFVIIEANSNTKCPNQIAWSVEGFLPKKSERVSLFYGKNFSSFTQVSKAKKLIDGCFYHVVIMNFPKMESLKFKKRSFGEE